MKKLLLIMIMSVLGMEIFAQNVPTAAENAFNGKFPNATNVKWVEGEDNEMEVSFLIGRTEMTANFSKDGEWLETSTSIPFSKLLSSIKRDIKKRFPKARLFKAMKSETAEKTIYEITLKQDGDFSDHYYDKNGVPMVVKQF
jgi:hypothetical protein